MVYLYRRMRIVLSMILVFVLSSSSISLAGSEYILPVVIKTSNIESTQDVDLGAGEMNQLEFPKRLSRVFFVKSIPYL